MTEKRFTMAEDEYTIEDNSKIISVMTREDILFTLNRLNDENEQLKKENKKLHSKIFEMRTNEALERTEISKQSYDGYKTEKAFLKELEKW